MLLDEIAACRDVEPHDNPSVQLIDPAFVQGYVDAQEPVERYHALVKLVDQLDDWHSFVWAPESSPAQCLPNVSIAILEDGMYVELDGVSPTPPKAGDPPPPREKGRVVAIDGYAPKTFGALVALMVGREHEPVSVTLEDYLGTRWTVKEPRLRYPIYEFPEMNPTLGAPTAIDVTLEYPPKHPVVRAGRVTGQPDVGYLELASMSVGDEARSLDLACQLWGTKCETCRAMIDGIRAVSSCHWIILNLMGGSGGTCAHAGAVAAALLPMSVKSMPFNHHFQPRWFFFGIPGGWDWKRTPMTNDDTRFIVLLDRSTFSASEHLAGALRAVPSTVFVGVRSAGSEYSVVEGTLPDGSKVRFGGNPGVWHGLPTVEGRGIPPTVRVPYDMQVFEKQGLAECLADHRRRCFEAALKVVDDQRAKESRTTATP